MMKKTLEYFILISIATIIVAILLFALGERPTLFLEAIKNSLFTDFGLGYTLFFTTPLIFTGLAVSVCFQCGLFNIGAEGQLYLGALAIVVLSYFFPNMPGFLAIPMGVAIAAAAGALLGAFTGYLKVKRGSHEVIVTILLNFIVYIFVNYVVFYPLDNPENQAAESVFISAPYFLSSLESLTTLFSATPVNTSLFLALFCAFLVHVFLFYTPTGYALRCVGQSPRASRFGGISVSKNTVLAFTLSGALAGLVGVNEVMGSQHRLIESFSPGYGFTGIAVSLLARNHPIGIIPSALLFGIIQNSSRELEFLSDKLTKEMAFVIQAILIAVIASHSIVKFIQSKMPKRGES